MLKISQGKRKKKKKKKKRKLVTTVKCLKFHLYKPAIKGTETTPVTYTWRREHYGEKYYEQERCLKQAGRGGGGGGGVTHARTHGEGEIKPYRKIESVCERDRNSQTNRKQTMPKDGIDVCVWNRHNLLSVTIWLDGQREPRSSHVGFSPGLRPCSTVWWAARTPIASSISPSPAATCTTTLLRRHFNHRQEETNVAGTRQGRLKAWIEQWGVVSQYWIKHQFQHFGTVSITWWVSGINERHWSTRFGRLYQQSTR